MTPFEKQTGCKVNVKVAGTSDEMVTLMKSGDYDVVSASGDAIAAADLRRRRRTGQHRPGAELHGHLRRPEAQAVELGERRRLRHPARPGREPADVPHRQGQPGADLVGRGLRRNSPYAGQVTAYDSPIYIADAALYLMKHQPDLGITNPYALDDTQFNAAVDLLKTQNKNIGEYWSDYTKEVEAFKSGDSVLGTTWQVIANLAQADKAPVEAILPTEGATGWSDTWMVAAKAKHPNCAYMWMNYIVSPRGERAGRRVVRRGAGEQAGLRADRRQELLRDVPRRRRGLLPARSGTGPRRSPSASTGGRT